MSTNTTQNEDIQHLKIFLEIAKDHYKDEELAFSTDEKKLLANYVDWFNKHQINADNLKDYNPLLQDKSWPSIVNKLTDEPEAGKPDWRKIFNELPGHVQVQLDVSTNPPLPDTSKPAQPADSTLIPGDDATPDQNQQALDLFKSPATRTQGLQTLAKISEANINLHKIHTDQDYYPSAKINQELAEAFKSGDISREKLAVEHAIDKSVTSPHPTVELFENIRKDLAKAKKASHTGHSQHAVNKVFSDLQDLGFESPASQSLTSGHYLDRHGKLQGNIQYLTPKAAKHLEAALTQAEAEIGAGTLSDTTKIQLADLEAEIVKPGFKCNTRPAHHKKSQSLTDK